MRIIVSSGMAVFGFAEVPRRGAYASGLIELAIPRTAGETQKGRRAMGIKFNCPNGHRLNVKSFLAGKRGICPHCGSKFVVPLQTGVVAVPGDENAAAKLPMQEVQGEGQPSESADEDFAFTLPTLASSAAPRAPMGSPGDAERARVGEVSLPDSSPAPSDPITAAPAALWYVRPRSGGQFGPAAADIMRTWLAEGRVAADSLVWREGWTDWQPAGNLFPQLNPAVVLPSPAPNKPRPSEPVQPATQDQTEPGFNLSQPETNSVLKNRKRRTKRQSNNWVVIVLALVAIVLIVLFLVVLYSRKTPPKPAPEARRTPSVQVVSATRVEHRLRPGTNRTTGINRKPGSRPFKSIASYLIPSYSMGLGAGERKLPKPTNSIFAVMALYQYDQ